MQGWNTSADPRRRQFEIKKSEMEEIKREMSEIERKRAMEHRDIVSEVITVSFKAALKSFHKSSGFASL